MGNYSTIQPYQRLIIIKNFGTLTRSDLKEWLKL